MPQKAAQAQKQTASQFENQNKLLKSSFCFETWAASWSWPNYGEERYKKSWNFAENVNNFFAMLSFFSFSIFTSLSEVASWHITWFKGVAFLSLQPEDLQPPAGRGKARHWTWAARAFVASSWPPRPVSMSMSRLQTCPTQDPPRTPFFHSAELGNLEGRVLCNRRRNKNRFLVCFRFLLFALLVRLGDLILDVREMFSRSPFKGFPFLPQGGKMCVSGAGAACTADAICNCTEVYAIHP